VTLVVKLGGRAQSGPALVRALASEWQRRGGKLAVLHGGGDEISALQRALGVEPEFVGGRRVTTARDLDLVRMVLSGAVNKRLVAVLNDAGAPAWGVSGEDASILEAVPLPPPFGHAGAPAHVNPEPLRMLLAAGFLPVISPVARNRDGEGALNVNGDDAAAAIAAALEASELLFVSDVPAVSAGDGSHLRSLTLDDARDLVASGVASGGMAAKLEAVARALAGGVARVRIADIHGVTDPNAGTLITAAAREALV
jgi:acetylglutamate kinase